MKPKTIVYVSCNPKALKSDLAWFADEYQLQGLCGFDMFPQTPHVEVVATLKLM